MIDLDKECKDCLIVSNCFSPCIKIEEIIREEIDRLDNENIGNYKPILTHLINKRECTVCGNDRAILKEPIQNLVPSSQSLGVFICQRCHSAYYLSFQKSDGLQSLRFVEVERFNDFTMYTMNAVSNRLTFEGY